MGARVQGLTGRVNSSDWFDTPWRELQPRQLEATDELFQERRRQIKLLAHRASETGVDRIRRLEDMVPLLFAHTAYKSYPETWFLEGRWDRMARWLDTLTTAPVPAIDEAGVTDIDDWVDRLAEVGHYLSCSSGTTGKCSIIPANSEDRAFTPWQNIKAMSWATHVPEEPRFRGFSLTPVSRNIRMMDAEAASAKTFTVSFRVFPGEPIRVGDVTQIVALRRQIAEGTAEPRTIELFEALSKARAEALERGVQSTAEAIVAVRTERLYIRGMLTTMWPVAKRVREMGYGRVDFHPENLLYTAGGAKGAVLPSNAREEIFDTFNISRERAYQFYGMQEINTAMPMCQVGRYHVPPWLILLVLNQTGDEMIERTDDEVEGRAAFFDLALHGRWAGVISGDKIKARYGRCACGKEGPTVGDEIIRFSSLSDGDRISCSGSIDAYVRGVA